MSSMRARVLSETRRLRVRLVASLKITSIYFFSRLRGSSSKYTSILRRRWSCGGIRGARRRLGVDISMEIGGRVGVHVRVHVRGGEVDDIQLGRFSLPEDGRGGRGSCCGRRHRFRRRKERRAISCGV